MVTNDLVFIDENYKIIGWYVGMEKETIAEYRKKYKIWTYKHFKIF